MGRVLFAVVLSLGWLCVPHYVHAAPAAKKLIQFGWDQPNTAYIRKNIHRMELQPFDGIVFNARYNTAEGHNVIFADNVISPVAVPWESFLPALEDIRVTRFTKFTDNFLRINMEPGTVDWFQDFSAPINNLTWASRFSAEAKLKGLFFDLEPYEGPIFQYSSRPFKDHYTFEQYAQQVRKRGEEVMQAIQSAHGDMTLFLPFGYGQAEKAKSSPTTHRYGLLRYFLDGMFSKADQRIVIIDGYEGSYGYKTKQNFADAYRLIFSTHRSLTTEPKAYDRLLKASFGLWLDYGSDKTGWNIADPKRNYFTPTRFALALRYALLRSDRYVWIYNQQPSWWTPGKLPQSYVDEVAKARMRAKRVAKAKR